MKRTLIVSAGLIATLFTADLAVAQTSRMDSDLVGRTSKIEFDRMNKEGASTVAAITPNSTKLSKADEDLMMQVAMGGMMQLETSKVAVQKSTNPEIREIAQAEIDEQTGLSAKLQEIATAKGVTLPSTPDAKTQEMVTKMQGMSGVALDRHYVQEHAVKGHETLDKVMSKVESRGQDANLMAVAKAAHPLVKTHLKVARELSTKMRSNSAMNSGK
ncbi:DUF4142 domain-containing protein [Fibrivirga algicola]|uniref:DUF4142 domain-containing protein n=1 Tax=Fibrivirga algicola TaxID=2950420 RepID=A0ABX0QDH1_9BACT|nr:DUF4142 domain-containing protein [Fibrivirga algicola]ARK09555.1 hypothetical protein A6C57_03970 [Fibrella sp. ES10-3-2-2]NID10435.1 DUF4142 domain-containing protein [Fibrivirga algicola]